MPEADGLFKSIAGTLRGLRPSEFPLAEPYRLRVKAADENSRLDDYAELMPEERYQLEQLQLINGLYPRGDLQPGQLFKRVE